MMKMMNVRLAMVIMMVTGDWNKIILMMMAMILMVKVKSKCMLMLRMMIMMMIDTPKLNHHWH